MACYLWHQAITRINVDLSSEASSGIHLRAISQEVPTNLIRNLFRRLHFKTTTTENELNHI